MAGSPQHVQLTADQVEVITLDQDFGGVEVLNVDGSAEVYFRVGAINPTVGGDGSHVLPAAIGALSIEVYTAGVTVVRLISDGTPKVSVRGL